MRSHNNWALYSTTPFTGPEICRVTFVSDFRCIQKARRKKVFVCCKDSIHKIVHSFVSSVSNCRCPRVLYSPFLLPLTDHPLPFIAPPQFLQEYLVCVISFLSSLDDYDVIYLPFLCFMFYVLLQAQTKGWTTDYTKIVQLNCLC
jgi:hypothetical protein